MEYGLFDPSTLDISNLSFQVTPQQQPQLTQPQHGVGANYFTGQIQLDPQIETSYKVPRVSLESEVSYQLPQLSIQTDDLFNPSSLSNLQSNIQTQTVGGIESELFTPGALTIQSELENQDNVPTIEVDRYFQPQVPSTESYYIQESQYIPSFQGIESGLFNPSSINVQQISQVTPTPTGSGVQTELFNPSNFDVNQFSQVTDQNLVFDVPTPIPNLKTQQGEGVDYFTAQSSYDLSSVNINIPQVQFVTSQPTSTRETNNSRFYGGTGLTPQKKVSYTRQEEYDEEAEIERAIVESLRFIDSEETSGGPLSFESVVRPPSNTGGDRSSQTPLVISRSREAVSVEVFTGRGKQFFEDLTKGLFDFQKSIAFDFSHHASALDHYLNLHTVISALASTTRINFEHGVMVLIANYVDSYITQKAHMFGGSDAIPIPNNYIAGMPGSTSSRDMADYKENIRMLILTLSPDITFIHNRIADGIAALKETILFNIVGFIQDAISAISKKEVRHYFNRVDGKISELKTEHQYLMSLPYFNGEHLIRRNDIASTILATYIKEFLKLSDVELLTGLIYGPAFRSVLNDLNLLSNPMDMISLHTFEEAIKVADFSIKYDESKRVLKMVSLASYVRNAMHLVTEQSKWINDNPKSQTITAALSVMLRFFDGTMEEVMSDHTSFYKFLEIIKSSKEYFATETTNIFQDMFILFNRMVPNPWETFVDFLDFGIATFPLRGFKYIEGYFNKDNAETPTLAYKIFNFYIMFAIRQTSQALDNLMKFAKDMFDGAFEPTVLDSPENPTVKALIDLSFKKAPGVSINIHDISGYEKVATLISSIIDLFFFFDNAPLTEEDISIALRSSTWTGTMSGNSDSFGEMMLNPIKDYDVATRNAVSSVEIRDFIKKIENEKSEKPGLQTVYHHKYADAKPKFIKCLLSWRNKNMSESETRSLAITNLLEGINGHPIFENTHTIYEALMADAVMSGNFKNMIGRVGGNISAINRPLIIDGLFLTVDDATFDRDLSTNSLLDRLHTIIEVLVEYAPSTPIDVFRFLESKSFGSNWHANPLLYTYDGSGSLTILQWLFCVLAVGHTPKAPENLIKARDFKRLKWDGRYFDKRPQKLAKILDGLEALAVIEEGSVRVDYREAERATIYCTSEFMPFMFEPYQIIYHTLAYYKDQLDNHFFASIAKHSESISFFLNEVKLIGKHITDGLAILYQKSTPKPANLGIILGSASLQEVIFNPQLFFEVIGYKGPYVNKSEPNQKIGKRFQTNSDLQWLLPPLKDAASSIAAYLMFTEVDVDTDKGIQKTTRILPGNLDLMAALIEMFKIYGQNFAQELLSKTTQIDALLSTVDFGKMMKDYVDGRIDLKISIKKHSLDTQYEPIFVPDVQTPEEARASVYGVGKYRPHLSATMPSYTLGSDSKIEAQAWSICTVLGLALREEIDIVDNNKDFTHLHKDYKSTEEDYKKGQLQLLKDKLEEVRSKYDELTFQEATKMTKLDPTDTSEPRRRFGIIALEEAFKASNDHLDYDIISSFLSLKHIEAILSANSSVPDTPLKLWKILPGKVQNKYELAPKLSGFYSPSSEQKGGIEVDMQSAQCQVPKKRHAPQRITEGFISTS
jgi:hypothetical protein